MVYHPPPPNPGERPSRAALRRSSTGPTLTRASAVTARDLEQRVARSEPAQVPPIATRLGSSVGPTRDAPSPADRATAPARPSRAGVLNEFPGPCDCEGPNASVLGGVSLFPAWARNCGSHSHRLPARRNPGSRPRRANAGSAPRRGATPGRTATWACSHETIPTADAAGGAGRATARGRLLAAVEVESTSPEKLPR